MYFVHRVIRRYRENGFMALCRIGLLKVWHKTVIRPDHIYYAYLTKLIAPKTVLNQACQVFERDASNPLSEDEYAELAGYIAPQMLEHQIRERFSMGAKLWLLKDNNTCIGMVWTLVGKTVEPFYYLVGDRDVHLFNNEIFKPYRGRGYNPPLIEYVLFKLKSQGYVRGYIETNQRNIAERRSLSRTSFIPVGKAIKMGIGKNRITLWRAMEQHDQEMRPVRIAASPAEKADSAI